ncbi:MAG: metallophosphatase family protein [Desulforhopalus sp.]|nr:metallophosphatase family protein [Desulforhopalus sp.]
MSSRLTSPLMPTRILLLADIHGNYPALTAIDRELDAASFDYIINCGDSLVYAPFPNETLRWLSLHRAVSILGNTDQKVIGILKGKTFGKPRKAEKRIMYTSTAEALDAPGRRDLLSFPAFKVLDLRHPASKNYRNSRLRLGIFHGSPADPDEFLFADTPDSRFLELTEITDCQIVVTGHSHTPYYKVIAGTHFINPGSAGRMFDGNPQASCAVMEITEDNIKVRHLRVSYDIDAVVTALGRHQLPEIYATMFLQGRKLN